MPRLFPEDKNVNKMRVINPKVDKSIEDSLLKFILKYKGYFLNLELILVCDYTQRDSWLILKQHFPAELSAMREIFMENTSLLNFRYLADSPECQILKFSFSRSFPIYSYL